MVLGLREVKNAEEILRDPQTYNLAMGVEERTQAALPGSRLELPSLRQAMKRMSSETPSTCLHPEERRGLGPGGAGVQVWTQPWREQLKPGK